MKVTLVMIFIAIIVFGITATMDNSEAFLNNYGFSGENLIARPYTLVTSIFLHASLAHLLANILAWFFFGYAVEKELGVARMLAIFFLGAIAGDFLSLLFYPSSIVGIGASAGIFALVGAGMLVKPLDLSFYPMIVPVPLIFLGIAYALYNVYEFFFAFDPTISYAGHFGGLIIGLAFGLRHTGMRKGLLTVIIALGIMILIPLLWMIVTRI
ncbi:rhomboid family intramembrane serine protease [archaeon]|nr:rhomboid family intramembrane serine protease [archaeon]